MTIEQTALFIDKRCSFYLKRGPLGYPFAAVMRGFTENEEYALVIDDCLPFTLSISEYENPQTGQKTPTYWFGTCSDGAALIAKMVLGKCPSMQRQLELVIEFEATKNKDVKRSERNKGWRGKRRMQMLEEMDALNKEFWRLRNLPGSEFQTGRATNYLATSRDQ